MKTELVEQSSHERNNRLLFDSNYPHAILAGIGGLNGCKRTVKTDCLSQLHLEAFYSMTELSALIVPSLTGLMEFCLADCRQLKLQVL
jgi:hypothetical protein